MGKRTLWVVKIVFPKDPWGTQVEHVYHPVFDQIPESAKKGTITGVSPFVVAR